MAKYSCAVSVTFEVYYDVEAENEDQARDKAEEMALSDETLCENIPDSAKVWNVELVNERERIDNYFNQCKAFWKARGDTEGIATSKAFWWDCVENWNCDKSWNPEKEKFALEFRNYKPGNPVPDEKLIENGGI